MTNEHKILLLVEARQTDADLITHMIKDADRYRTLQVAVATTIPDGINQLSDTDVVILDLSASLGPHTDAGLETFRALKRAADIPIVVITCAADEALGLQVVKEGAQDYLVLGQFYSQTLYRSLLYAMERHRREIAEHRLDEVLSALGGMRREIGGLATEVHGCRIAIADLSTESFIKSGTD